MESETTTSSVKTYIEKNLVAFENGRCCVDGRYERGSNEVNKIARAGADFGYVMVLLAVNKEKNLGLKVEDCVDRVFEAVTSDGEGFSLHTDHHSAFPKKGDGSLIGCGHIAKAADSSLTTNYGLDPEEVKGALAYFAEVYLPKGNVNLVTLPGEHQEKAVLVFSGNKKTVAPNDHKEMFFVYDKTRDEEYLASLVAKLNIPSVTFEDFQAASSRQTRETLHQLALGLPIFEVVADKEISVVEAGKVV